MMTHARSAQRWLLIAGLYFTQGIPLGLAMEALPALLRRQFYIPRRCPLYGPVCPFPRRDGIRTPAAPPSGFRGLCAAVPKMSGSRPALMASHFRL